MSEFSMEPPTFVALATEVSPFRVDPTTDDLLKPAVEFCAQCFKRELGFDFAEYVVASHGVDVNVEAYVFHELARDLLDELAPSTHRVIGACAFHRLSPRSKKWRLQWVWFHPFARRNGHLTAAWPQFSVRYGKFDILKPLTLAMKKFRKKRCQ